MKKLILIRGVPGSGKSTLAKSIWDESDTGIHLETDQYFIRPDGSYAWYAAELSKAHAWCFDLAAKFMKFDAASPIVVSNTFTRLREMQPYVDAAKAAGYTVEIITCTGEYENVHGAPEEVVQRMRDRFEHDHSSLLGN